MSWVGRVCSFAAGALGYSLGVHGYSVHQASKDLPQPQRGSLIWRMLEVAMAWRTTYTIVDSYTASRHLHTLRRISSQKSSKRSAEDGNEIEKANQPGYLQDYFQKHPQVKTPVFAYKHVVFDKFINAGSIENMQDVDARKDILKGNYVRCKDSLVTNLSENDKKKLGYDLETEKSMLSDIILTGTKNCNTCENFKIAHLNALAELAAMGELDPKHSISKTPVAVRDEGQNSLQFTLTTLNRLSSKHKQYILDDYFVSCRLPDKLQPVAGGVKLTPRALIVVGTSNPKFCDFILRQNSENEKTA
jgi:hypothetical protein